MQYIISVLVSLVFAFACAAIASGKGRSRALFGILGFFFSIITLIVVLIVPSKTRASV
jgi:hypothetical protein